MSDAKKLFANSPIIHAFDDIRDVEMIGRCQCKCIGKIGVEHGLERSPRTLLVKPLDAIARRGDADQMFASDSRTFAHLAHLPMPETRAEDPLDITFQHGGRGAKPDRVDKHDDIRISEGCQLDRNIIRRHKGF